HRRRRRPQRCGRERVHHLPDPGHPRPDHPRHQAAWGASQPRSRRDRQVHRATAGPPRRERRHARGPRRRRQRRAHPRDSGGRAMNHLFGWADVVAFRLGGETVRWSDLLGNLLGLATVALALRRSLWTWPVQITGAILLFGADMAVHLGGTAARQLAVIALAGYGWSRWRSAGRGRDANTGSAP